MRGTKVYFPSTVFTMVRSGVQRAANTAVFRVPRFLTKMDITAYLEGVYPGVAVAKVETHNFLARTNRLGTQVAAGRKNAVVTFSRGFVPFPEAGTLRYPLAAPNAFARVHPKGPIRLGR